MTGDALQFNLSSVFESVAAAIPDETFCIWRDRRLSYGAMNDRVDGVANYLAAAGLGCHTERDRLAGHESGQDHLGIYLRNGNEYLESMIASYRARLAPFNVSYRYVEEELVYLLNDARAAVLVYNAEFAPRVAAIRDRLPTVRLLIQVADDSGNDLLPDAIDYEAITTTSAPASSRPEPSGDDLYILYTGGTTGMPKGVLWRQHDIFISAMGGRPVGGTAALQGYGELVAQASRAPGTMSLLMIPPLMHGAAQWGAFTAVTMGGRLVMPDDVEKFRPAQALQLAAREKIMGIMAVGDAIARPLVDELERGDYDLSGLMTISNGGAPVTPVVRERLRAALPSVILFDGVGSSESGMQMSAADIPGTTVDTAAFTPQPDTTVVSSDFSRVLAPGDGEGWLARRDLIPLGYLNDEAKSARTFPMIDSVRWSIPGDRARILADGRIELLGRDSVTINSGGEKIFAEEVERAITSHPAVYDVVVVGRPSERWGSEVVAVVQLVGNASPSDAELAAACRTHIASYKIPKAFIRVPKVERSPAGKADYRWANSIATEMLSSPVT
ncbi:acyl-CoA synthetase [Mycobacterium sp. M23085]|uniref:acyl-CoA synthetase n=1 Tax=Mycobacterium sp. M23085 TaxID=3378087 RepID=UPI003878214E